YTASPLRDVVINEFLANSDGEQVDYIELYNHSNRRIDISGCGLSDDKNTNKFVFPGGTFIESNAFIVVTQPNLNFGLNSGGETMYFWAPGRARLLDAITFDAQAANVSSGRWPDGAAEFYPLKNLTPGAPNGPILIRDIVINEIMYKPISGDQDDEYVEIYNKGSNTVNLGGWRFVSAIDYTFPPNTLLASNGYLVIARNVQQLISHYPNLNAGNTLGEYDGALANSGERLALGMPDISYTTNGLGEVSSNIVYVIVDEVTYNKSGNYWPHWSDGGGSSLELIDARSNHRLGFNWADSDESTKGGWTTVESVGGMDFGADTPNMFEVLAMGDGEYLVDNAEIFGGTNSAGNLLTPANSTLDSGLGGWGNRGTHIRSTWDATGGIGNSGCLHVRASDRGDSIANRNVCPLTANLAAVSGVATIRAQVRWLKGWPEILLRVHGNHIEALRRL